MKKLLRLHTKPAPEENFDALIEANKQRRGELHARDRDLLSEEIALTKMPREPVSAVVEAEQAEIDAAARRLVAGHGSSWMDALLASVPSGDRVSAIRKERKAITVALGYLDTDLRGLSARRYAAEWERRGEEWRENRRAFALAIADLQRLAIEGETISKEIRRGSGHMSLPGEIPIGRLSIQHNSGPLYDHTQVILNAGYVTPGEIARVRGISK